MRLLIDECLPRALKRFFIGHECRTVQEMGWSGKKNGDLLSLAEAEFDVLATIDHLGSIAPGRVATIRA
jgi:predicted nuclease of predicted toxin-antitoxin system